MEPAFCPLHVKNGTPEEELDVTEDQNSKKVYNDQAEEIVGYSMHPIRLNIIQR